MAKRRKKTKSYTRRRRMSGVGKSAVMDAVGVIAGAVAGRLVAKKMLPNVDEKIKNAGVVALGVFMPKLIKGSFGSAIGSGMIASGGVGLVGSFLPAIAAVDGEMIEFPISVGEIDDNLSVIAGDDSVMAGDDSVMAGDDSLSILAGMDEDDDF
jgi:hypothetical protein